MVKNKVCAFVSVTSAFDTWVGQMILIIVGVDAVEMFCKACVKIPIIRKHICNTNGAKHGRDGKNCEANCKIVTRCSSKGVLSTTYCASFELWYNTKKNL